MKWPNPEDAGGGSKKKICYPASHQVGVEVPKGGSSCASCKWLSKDAKHCEEQQFVKWLGTSELPFPANRYCCDLWTDAPKTKMASASELRKSK